jgi:hypothetical protein
MSTSSSVQLGGAVLVLEDFVAFLVEIAMAVVHPEERTFAAGVTQLVRVGMWAPSTFSIPVACSFYWS